MYDPPLAPVSDLADVPVERPTVGGMGSPTLGTYLNNETRFKPYVYRGTGVDIYEEPPPPRAKPKRDPAKIRAANVKRYAKMKRESKKRRSRFDTRPRHYWVQPRPPGYVDLPTAEDWEVDFATMSTGDAPEHWRKRVSGRATFTPASGNDIDNWLNEMEEE